MKYVITAKKKDGEPKRLAAAESASVALAIAQLFSRSGLYEYAFAWRLWKGRIRYDLDERDTPERLREKEAALHGH